MSAKCVFSIRPLSVDKGFELACEGITREPLRVQRLIEAVLAAAQIGQGMKAEIRIFDTAGEVAEVLELNQPPTSQLRPA
jgi:hypothetical protein